MVKRASKPRIVAAALVAIASQGRTRAAAAYDWLQFDGDARHAGNNTAETLLSSANVGSLEQHFRVSLPAVSDGAPVLLTGVATASGTRDLLYVTTKDGHILALDAGTGATVWSHQNGPGSCHINNGSSACFMTASPAIDPSRAHVFAYGLDGRVHQYAVGDGTEVTTGGWPELVSNKAFDEKGSGALTVATAASGATYLYVVSGGYPGDNGDYQGHVTVIRLSDGSQRVFNSVCSNQAVHFVEQPSSPDCGAVQSAVWARDGVVYDPDIDKLFFGTGNGDYQPSSHYWGDSVLAINPDGTGNAAGDPLDAYTPGSFSHLQSADLDLGSTAPALLPVPVASSVRHLAVQAGKDGILRLINLDNLSGQGGPGHPGGEVATMNVPQGGLVLPTPAVWTNPSDASTWAFVANSSGVSGLKLAVNGSGTPSLTTMWTSTNSGTSPLVANNVLYVASSGQVRALAPTTGAELASVGIGNVHWESPMVANGTLYVTDESGNLTSFTAPAPPSVPAAPAGASATMAVLLLAAGAFRLARRRRSLRG